MKLETDRKDFSSLQYLGYHEGKLIFNTSFYDACLILVVGRNACFTNNFNKGKAVDALLLDSV